MFAPRIARILVVALALFAMASLASAEDSARDLRDQVLADLRTLRDQATDPPVLPHLRNAVTFLERSLDQFTDAEHILDPPQALDNLRQTIDSCTVAAKEALRAVNSPLADALKAGSLKLAQAARRLAATLLGEVQSPEGIIGSESAGGNAAAIQTAQDEIANGDEQLGQQDASFNRYNYSYQRFDQALNRYKAAWLAAQGADAFLLRLLPASEATDPFSPNGDSRRETCTLTAQLQVASPASGARVRGEWTLLSAGVRVRRVTVEQDAPQGSGILDFTLSLSWDGLDDAGAPAPDALYDWQFTAVLLPPGAPENPLTGSLSGDVTLDRAAPTFGATRPGAIVAGRRPEIGVPFADVLSGIDVASATITVEGFDRTSAATRTAEGISFTPTDPFPDGEVTASATVRDLAETEGSLAWSFRVVSALGSADPASGGTLTVTDAESLAYGASIQVPAGALAEPATLTISIPTESPALGEIVAPSGQVIDISSSVSTFSQDILLTIPYDQAMVDAAGIDERALEVFFHDGSAWVSIAVVSRDADSNLLTIAVRHLSVFLVGYRRASATLSTLSVDPTRLMADGQDQAAITVVPRDAGGVPLGPYRTVEVRFRPYVGPPPGPPPPGGSISSVSNAGDESYRATLTSGTAIETVTLEAIAQGVLLALPVSVSYETAVAGFLVTTPSPVAAGAPVLLTVTAVDSQGLLVRSYRGRVRLDSSDPQASFNDTTIDLGAANNGQIVSNIGSFQLAGTHRIQVEDTSRPAIQGESGNVVVSPGAAAALRKTFGDFQSGDAGTWLVDPIRAQIEDEFGNAIPGQALKFEAMTGDEAVSTTSGGTPSTTLTVQTDALGEAQVFVRLDSTPGANAVEVRFPGVASVTFTLSGTGLVVPDAIAIAAVTPVAVGTESEVTITLTGNGVGVPGKLGQLTVASSRAADAFSPLSDNGDGTYTTTVSRNVAGVSRVTATYADGTTTLVSGQAVVGFQAPNRLTLEGASPIPVNTPGRLTIRLFVDQTPVSGMALQLSMASSRPTDDFFGNIQVEGDGVYSVDVTSGTSGVADLQAFFDDPATPTPNDLSSNVVSVVFQTVAAGPPPPRVIESDPADGEGGVPLNKVVSVTFDRAMDTGGLTSSAFAIFGGQEVSFGFLQWRRVNWNAYNQANGETWPACGDLDGDGRDEIVLGLGTWPGSGGWLQILDDEGTGYSTLGWIQLPWSAYNNVDGQVRPACGDFDGDGRDEIVVGLGPFPSAGGFLHIWDDKVAGFARLGWIRMAFPPYNAANGETRPACGDVDGDGRDEIVIGTGSYPANGGYVNILDDARSTPPHKLVAWMRLSWSGYNAANGETRPACGDVDGDGRAEIVLGMGPYPGPATGGWMQVRDDAGLGFAPLKWIRANHPLYNQVDGSTFPACGDVDGDHRAEVLTGFGTHTSNGGWIQVMDGAETSYRHLGWAKVQWPAYNLADGQTRPAAGNLRGDRVEEFIVGLGPYRSLGGLAGVMDSRGNMAGRVCFHDDDEGRTVAKFTPDLQFLPNESYHIEVRDVADLQGKMMDQVASTPARDPFVASFSTDIEDHYLPEVLETSPANGARDVALNTEIRVRFNERMDGTQAWGSLVYLTEGASTYAGTVSMEEEGVVVVLRGPFVVNGTGAPTWLLGRRDMQIVVSGAAKDRAGNAMVQGYTSSFLTLDPLVRQVTLAYPANGTRVAAGVTIVGGLGPSPWGYDVELSINEGTNAELRLRTRVDARGNWMQPVSFLAGTHTLRARGVSGDGQLSAPTSLVTITAVSNQPAMVVTEPVQGDRINQPRFRMRVEARYSSTISLAGTQVFLDSLLSPIPLGGASPLRLENDSDGSSNGVPFWQADVVGVPDGRHTLIAVKVGTATVALTVDNTSPVITATLEPGADLQGVLRTFPFKVEFTAEDPGSGLNVYSLELTANGEDIHCEVSHGQGLDPAGGRPEDPSVPQKLRAIWTPTIEELAALLQKTQTNQLRACIEIRDLTGNFNSSCIEFTIDYSAAGGGGGGGDGGGDNPFPGVRRLPRSIVLRIAVDSLEFEEGLTSRCTTTPPVVEAVDAMRGNALVKGIATSWDVVQGEGLLVEHTTLSTVTNAEGQAGMRFVNGDEAGDSVLRVSALGDDSIRPVELTRRGHLPKLLLVQSARNTIDQEPLLVREAFSKKGPWVFRAIDPGPEGTGETPIEDTEIGFALLTLDPATGLYVEAPAAGYLLPTSEMTDAKGYCEFDFEARTPGQYKLEARLSEFPGVSPYIEPGAGQTIEIANDRLVRVRFFQGGGLILGPLQSIIRSGNGQIGVEGQELLSPFVLDVGGFARALDASARAQIPPWEFVAGSVSLLVEEGPVSPDSWDADRTAFRATGTLSPADPIPMLLSSGDAQVFFTPSKTTTHAIRITIEGSFRLLMDPPPPAFAGSIRIEALSVGPPEVRLVEPDPQNPGTRIAARTVVPWDPEAAAVQEQYLIEARLPLSQSVTSTAGGDTFDDCATPLTSISGAIATVNPRNAPLTRTGATARFALYRTPATQPIVFVRETVFSGQTLPSLPAGPSYVQVDGYFQPFATVSQFAGSRIPITKLDFVAARVAPVRGLPSVEGGFIRDVFGQFESRGGQDGLDAVARELPPSSRFWVRILRLREQASTVQVTLTSTDPSSGTEERAITLDRESAGVYISRLPIVLYSGSISPSLRGRIEERFGILLVHNLTVLARHGRVVTRRGSYEAFVDVAHATDPQPNLLLAGSGETTRIVFHDTLGRAGLQVQFSVLGTNTGAIDNPTLTRITNATGFASAVYTASPGAVVARIIVSLVEDDGVDLMVFVYNEGWNFRDLSANAGMAGYTDVTFVDNTAMTAAQVQAFLTTQSSFLASYSEGGRPAAQIIKDAADAHIVNPKVILATLQKEQSLVTQGTALAPTHSRMQEAMGIPVATVAGFALQVNSGALSLRNRFDEAVTLLPIADANKFDAQGTVVTDYFTRNRIWAVPGLEPKNPWVAVAFLPANASTRAQHRYTNFVTYRTDSQASTTPPTALPVGGVYKFVRVWRRFFAP